MKRTFLLVLLVAATVLPAAAQDILGAGIILGEPTGISVKAWLDEGMAADAAVAWSFMGDPSLYIHANALYHINVLDTGSENYLAPYLGVGANLRFGNDLGLGLRVPIGVSLLLNVAPVELFAEFSPGIGLLPETGFDPGAGLGARFYFPL